jgi:hypothetical protein
MKNWICPTYFASNISSSQIFSTATSNDQLHSDLPRVAAWGKRHSSKQYVGECSLWPPGEFAEWSQGAFRVHSRQASCVRYCAGLYSVRFAWDYKTDTLNLVVMVCTSLRRYRSPSVRIYTLPTSPTSWALSSWKTLQLAYIATIRAVSIALTGYLERPNRWKLCFPCHACHVSLTTKCKLVESDYASFCDRWGVQVQLLSARGRPCSYPAIKSWNWSSVKSVILIAESNFVRWFHALWAASNIRWLPTTDVGRLKPTWTAAVDTAVCEFTC